MQTNLDYLIYDAKFKDGYYFLTEKQKQDILYFVGKGCRETTKAKLSRRLDVPLILWETYGIFKRIILNDEGASYICGQSWTDEMRTLRECILTN